MNKSIYYIILFILSYYLCSGQETVYDSIENPIESQEESLDTSIFNPFQTTLQLSKIPSHGNLQVLSLLQNRNANLSIRNNSGSPGASISANFRGRKSFFNDYSPLIILDGLPIDNSEWNNSLRGTDQSNRMIDINPFDIASAQIIPGSVGTVLHGIRGSNGVIILTSKKGTTSKPKIHFQSETTIARVGKLPKRQSTYAQGVNTTDGPLYRGPETSNGFSWGPAIGTLEFATDPEYPYDKNGRLVPFGQGNGTSAIAYDPYVFFQNALSQNLNASVMGGTKYFKYYVSGGRNTINGVIPKTNYIRNSIFGSISSTLGNKLDISVSGRYVNSNSYRNLKGSTLRGVMLGLLRNSPTFDITNGLSPSEAVDDPSSYINPDGSQRSYRNGIYDSPYWSINKNPHDNLVNRRIGFLSLNYRWNENVHFYINGGIDSYSDDREGGEDIVPGRHLGIAYVRERDFTTSNLNAGTKISKSIFKNIEADLTIGINYFDSNTTDTIIQGSTLLSPDFISIFNLRNINFTSDKNTNKNLGLLSSLDLRFNKSLLLNFGIRHDYSSTLGVDQKGFLSFGFNSIVDIVSLMNIKNEHVTSLQFFAGYGRSGQASPTRLTNTSFEPAIINSSAFLEFNELPGFLELSEISGNPNLKAEKTDAFEIGISTSILSGKVNFKTTFYYEKTSDIILLKEIAPSSGFSRIFDNAATISNKGIDIQLSLSLLKSNKFSWNINSFFNTNKNTVDEILFSNEKNIFLGGFTSTSSRIIEGEAYGALWGSAFLRDENDRIIIGDDGFPEANPERSIIGNPNPKFTLGLENQFKLGEKLSINVLLDLKYGGEHYCGTCGVLNYFGISQLAADERNTSIVFDGVTENGVQNTQLVNLADPNGSSNFYYRLKYGFGGLPELNVFDATWVKIRRIHLNYDLSSYTRFVPLVYKFSVGLYVDNLLIHTNYPGIDPENNLLGNSNGFGLDYFNNPSSSTFGISLNLSL